MGQKEKTFFCLFLAFLFSLTTLFSGLMQVFINIGGFRIAKVYLADSKNSKTCRPVASDNKDQIVSGYVFGGIYAVPKAVMNDYERASGCPVSK